MSHSFIDWLLRLLVLAIVAAYGWAFFRLVSELLT